MRTGEWYSCMKKLIILFSALTLMIGIVIGPAILLGANVTALAAEIQKPSEKRTTPQELSTEDLNIVDEISFATHSISQGEISSFMVKFSEKSTDQIIPGDTLTLKLPKGVAGLQTNGAPTKLELRNKEGVLFATALIYGDKVVTTFEKAVDNLDNINGYFNVAIVGSNVNTQTDRDKDYVVTDLNMGVPPVNAKGEKVNKNGLTIRGVPNYVPERPTGEFSHYKAGDMLNGFNEVRWFININPNQANVQSFDKNIIIKDTLGPGQALQRGTFMVSSTTWVNGAPVTSWEPLAKILKSDTNPDGWATATMDEATNSFRVELDVTHAPGNKKLDGTSFALSYTTKVTDEFLETFTNSYDVDYQIDGKDPVHDSQTIPVKNIRVSGGADGNGRPKPPTTLKEFEANVMTGDPDAPEEETVDPLPETKPDEDHANETTEDDNSGTATEEKPPVILNNGQLIEETLTEEQLEILEEVIKEHAEGHLEAGHTHEIEVNGKPLVLNDSQIIEELLTEEQIDKLKDIIEEHADMTEIKDESNKATDTNVPNVIDPQPESKTKPTHEQKSEANPDVSDESNKTIKNRTKATTLPATGYSANSLLTIVGLILVVFGVFGVFFNKKSH